MKKQRGQALLEALITHGILLFLCFSVVEVSRLLAFKSVLQSTVFDMAQKISFAHLELKKKNLVPMTGSSGLMTGSYSHEISLQIAHVLKNFDSSLLSFDRRSDNSSALLLSLREHTPRVYLKFDAQTGVSLKVNACLPVLFSSYFRIFSKVSTINIGASLSESNDAESSRNCLGEYTSEKKSVPLFWFTLNAKASVPWPASTRIYENGLGPAPKHVFGLENEYRQLAARNLKIIHLTQFLTGTNKK